MTESACLLHPLTMSCELSVQGIHGQVGGETVPEEAIKHLTFYTEKHREENLNLKTSTGFKCKHLNMILITILTL